MNHEESYDLRRRTNSRLRGLLVFFNSYFFIVGIRTTGVRKNNSRRRLVSRQSSSKKNIISVCTDSTICCVGIIFFLDGSDKYLRFLPFVTVKFLVLLK